MVDVDDWIKCCFECCSRKVTDSLVDGDHLRVVVAPAGTADLESKAVGFFVGATIREIVASVGVIVGVSDFETFGSSVGPIGAVKKFVVEKGAGFVFVGKESVEEVAGMARH